MKSKVKSLEEALAPIKSGSTLALAGALLRRQPNAAVRQLIRNGVKDLSVIGWVTTTAIDLLAAAGAIKRFEGAYAGMFSYGLAPNFRREVEAGKIEVADFSESAMVARFRAASAGLPFYPSVALLGSDLARYNPEQIREIVCPFTGKRMHAIAPAEADFTIVHGYTADEFGNVQWPVVRDSDDIDQMIASASKRLIVTVEKIVSSEEVRRQPTLTYIPGTWVEAVVEVPFGAHPVACDTFYDEDGLHLEEYITNCKTVEGSRAYLQNKVFGVRSHEDYLEAVGMDRLSQLRV